MHFIIFSLLAAAGAGKTGGGVKWRRIVKGGFKQGIRLSRHLQSTASAVRQEAKQLVDEARAEIDGPVKRADTNTAEN